jgi:hypothetical protein
MNIISKEILYIEETKKRNIRNFERDKIYLKLTPQLLSHLDFASWIFYLMREKDKKKLLKKW